MQQLAQNPCLKAKLSLRLVNYVNVKLKHPYQIIKYLKILTYKISSVKGIAQPK